MSYDIFVCLWTKNIVHKFIFAWPIPVMRVRNIENAVRLL